jgi:two-component system, chemotaxis family, CheB/CheR fusion protein
VTEGTAERPAAVDERRPPEHAPPSTRDEDGQLVVIGASAGGIDALLVILGELDADFPAPIVIAQHLDPRRESMLATVFDARTALRVVSVDGPVPLAPGVVYVVPSDRDVEIDAAVVRITEDGSTGPRPSVDRLFSSAARAFGERLIAVILSGSGSDGAAGAHLVKAAGGTVVIQDPMTAASPGMPSSLAPTTVDIAADLDTIASLLVSLVEGDHLPAARDQERTLPSFLDEVRDRTGVDFSAYKQPTILRRLQRRMLDTRSRDLREYARYMRQHPEEYERLVSTFLIKVTHFFRDPDLFAYLRDDIVPELVERAQTTGELRIWSAGTATGEEAYSLAMLVAERLDGGAKQITVRVFATDLDTAAVEFARRGIYSRAAVAGLPEHLLERYFIHSDGDYEVTKSIRAMTVFGQHDLAQRAPFPRTDLVLCRNVLIYFTPTLQRRAMQLFAFSLREGGLLVLGKGEHPRELDDLFEPEHGRLKVYRRIGRPVALPRIATRGGTPDPTPGGDRPPSRSARQASAPRGEGLLPSSSPPLDRSERLLADLPVGIVILDSEYDIVSINPTARRVLGVHGAAIGRDFVHQVERLAAPSIRGLIDGALRGEAGAITVAGGASASDGGERPAVRLLAGPLAGDGGRRLAAIIATDVSGEAKASAALEAELDRSRAERAASEAMVDELRRSNAELLAANDELLRANAAFRTATEELLVSTEEAQAATEEVETLNEELQATNEELETLNEELQATNEELNAATSELEARQQQLEHIAASLETERAAARANEGRLVAVLAAMEDAVMVVDSGGRVVLANAAAERWFGATGDRLVAADPDGVPLPREAQPIARMARREAFAIEFTVDAPEGGRRWYEALGRPLVDRPGDAGIIVVHDVTEGRLRALQERFIAMAGHELRTPLTAVRGYLAVLARRLDLEETDPRAELLAETSRQAQVLSALVDELLDAARLRSDHVALDAKRIDAVALVELAVATATALGERPFEIDAPDEPVYVLADARRLEQAVLNLLTNSVTHAPGADPIRVEIARGRKEVVIAVRDNGPGIAMSRRRDLFEPFGAQDGDAPTGLGLGLYIARRIVEAHDGTITVESEPGRGATFSIRLPVSARRKIG